MKKHVTLTLLLGLCLLLSACTAQANQSYYENAQLYLGCKDYDNAAELFEQLGEYEDSAEYALYARALQAMEEEDYDLARANMSAVNPFKSSGRYLMYLDALDLEAEGKLTEAKTLYEKLGTFMEANLSVERLDKAIPEAAIKEGRALMVKGEYAAARELFLSLNGYGSSKILADNCTVALNKAAYSEADALAEAGDLLGAMAAFTALGDSLDAAERAAACLDAIHAALDERYQTVALSTAPALIEAYENLPEDDIAQERIAELTTRFGKNLELMTTGNACVQLGAYPYAESGEERPVLWQVVKTDGAALTLLSTAVLDASTAAETMALMFTTAEQSAVGEPVLPSVADLALVNDRTAAATPYALAQGAPVEGDMALYWLRDSLENGMHPVIGGSGALTLPEENTTYGLRPMITLNLDAFTFTNGSGTENDPFRAE